MSEFGRRKNNVIRGRFGGAQRGRKWMSAADYAQLSPAEKKQIWIDREYERQLTRHERRYRPKQKRMPRWQRSMIVVLAFAAIGSVTWINERLGGTSSIGAPAALIGTSGEDVGTRSFGLCVWGGGTNCVVDGDTFYLDGTKIRIAGIDAPETHDFKCSSEKALGDRATERLQELLNSGPLAMSSIDRDEDIYGRKLRNVSVNGADIGEALVNAGLARKYLGRKMPWC